HCDPILIALSPVMAIHRGAETLIVLQTVWLASAAIPIYLVGRDRLGDAFGTALGLAYLSFPSLHTINLFDFHSLALSIPVVVWVVYFLDRRNWVAYDV